MVVDIDKSHVNIRNLHVDINHIACRGLRYATIALPIDRYTCTFRVWGGVSVLSFIF